MKTKMKSKIERQISNLPTLRISFFIFNVLLLLIGIAYVGVGSWLIETISSRLNIDDFIYFYSSMGGITITVGAIVILLALFGFLVSLLKNYYHASIAYLVMISFVLLFGIANGIVGLSYSTDVPNQISRVLNFNYFNSTNGVNVRNVDSIQASVCAALSAGLFFSTVCFKYKCCGINLPTDWQVFLGRNNEPASCCESTQQTNPCVSFFKEGCFKKVQVNIATDMSTTGGLAIGLAMPMIIGIVIAIALIVEQKKLRNEIKYSVTK